jgi:hypothetical protein
MIGTAYHNCLLAATRMAWHIVTNSARRASRVCLHGRINRRRRSCGRDAGESGTKRAGRARNGPTCLGRDEDDARASQKRKSSRLSSAMERTNSGSTEIFVGTLARLPRNAPTSRCPRVVPATEGLETSEAGSVGASPGDLQWSHFSIFLGAMPPIRFGKCIHNYRDKRIYIFPLKSAMAGHKARARSESRALLLLAYYF